MKEESKTEEAFLQLRGAPTFAEAATDIKNIVAVIKEKKGIDITDINDKNIYIISVSRKLMFYLVNKTKCVMPGKVITSFGVPVAQTYIHKDCARCIIKPNSSTSSTTVYIFTKKMDPEKANFEEQRRIELLEFAVKHPELNCCLVIKTTYKYLFKDILRDVPKDGIIYKSDAKIYDTIYPNVKLCFDPDFCTGAHQMYVSESEYCYNKACMW
nr:MAG TPA: hypothetical protein [Caudoviricetes sp.]